jgi:hypothetical protein
MFVNFVIYVIAYRCMRNLATYGTIVECESTSHQKTTQNLRQRGNRGMAFWPFSGNTQNILWSTQGPKEEPPLSLFLWCRWSLRLVFPHHLLYSIGLTVWVIVNFFKVQVGFLMVIESKRREILLSFLLCRGLLSSLIHVFCCRICVLWNYQSTVNWPCWNMNLYVVYASFV